MPIINNIDPTLRRVYLHADTVGTSIHPIDIYKEMRSLRVVDETLRPYDVFMSAFGNVPKGGGKFTERYVRLNAGTRVVPYDTDHELTITGTLITDDGQEGIACFDRSSLAVSTQVDINYVPPQVEVIVLTSLAATTAFAEQIADAVWDEPLADHINVATFGGYVGRKLLSFTKFIAGQ